MHTPFLKTQKSPLGFLGSGENTAAACPVALLFIQRACGVGIFTKSQNRLLWFTAHQHNQLRLLPCFLFGPDITAHLFAFLFFQGLPLTGSVNIVFITLPATIKIENITSPLAILFCSAAIAA